MKSPIHSNRPLFILGMLGLVLSESAWALLPVDQPVLDTPAPNANSPVLGTTPPPPTITIQAKPVTTESEHVENGDIDNYSRKTTLLQLQADQEEMQVKYLKAKLTRIQTENEIKDEALGIHKGDLLPRLDGPAFGQNGKGMPGMPLLGDAEKDKDKGNVEVKVGDGVMRLLEVSGVGTVLVAKITQDGAVYRVKAGDSFLLPGKKGKTVTVETVSVDSVKLSNGNTIRL